MFKPTHILHHNVNSILKKMFPKGTPVIKGETDEDGLIEWLADEEGNIGGYAYEDDSRIVKI